MSTDLHKLIEVYLLI